MTFEEANNVLGRWYRGEEPYGDVLEAIKSFTNEKYNICLRCKHSNICEAIEHTVTECNFYFPR